MSGGSTNTTTSTQAPTSTFANAYTNLLGQAAGVASQPYQQYPGNLVAPLSSDQTAGISAVEGAQGAANPYIAQAAQDASAATTPLWSGVQQFSPSAVSQYESPYTSQVLGATEASEANTDAQQQEQLQGNAISSGAWGGDRSGVAQGILGGQQALANNTTNANIENTAYTQALGEFNNQQSTQLGANEANSWLNSQASAAYANLGNEVENQDLTGANALLSAGGLQQNQAQEQLNIPYEQYTAAQAYPFQTTSWLTGLASQLGAASGGTATTTSPAASPVSQIAGIGTAAIGGLGATGAFGSASNNYSGWLTNLFGSGASSAATDAATSAGSSAAEDASNAFLSSMFGGFERGGPIPERATGGIVLPFPHRPRAYGGGIMGVNDNGDIDEPVQKLAAGGSAFSVISGSPVSAITLPGGVQSYVAPGGEGATGGIAGTSSGVASGATDAAAAGSGASSGMTAGGMGAVGTGPGGSMTGAAGSVGGPNVGGTVGGIAGGVMGGLAGTAMAGPMGGLAGNVAGHAAGSSLGNTVGNMMGLGNTTSMGINASDPGATVSNPGMTDAVQGMAETGGINGGMIGGPASDDTGPGGIDSGMSGMGSPGGVDGDGGDEGDGGGDGAEGDGGDGGGGGGGGGGGAMMRGGYVRQRRAGGIVIPFQRRDIGGLIGDDQDDDDAPPIAGPADTLGPMGPPPSAAPSGGGVSAGPAAAATPPVQSGGIAPAPQHQHPELDQIQAPPPHADPWMSLMDAGFAIASGRSSHPLENIGAGAQKGVQEFVSADHAAQQLSSQVQETKARLTQSAQQMDQTGDYQNAQVGLGKDRLTQQAQQNAAQNALKQKELAQTGAYQQGELGIHRDQLAQTGAYQSGELNLRQQALDQDSTQQIPWQMPDPNDPTKTISGVLQTSKKGGAPQFFPTTGNQMAKPDPTAAAFNAPGAAQTGVSGDDYLKTLNPNIATQVKALAEGRMAFPTGFATTKPYWQNMIQAVAQYDPTFNASDYNARSRALTDLTSGKGAQNITSLNTTIGHMGTLLDAADKLNNGSVGVLNTVGNAFNSATGDPRVNNFNLARNAVADEMTRVFRGTGGSEQEVQSWKSTLNDAQSPQQLHGAIQQGVNLLQSRISAMNDQIQRAGLNHTEHPIALISPESQQVLSRLEGLDKQGGGGGQSGGTQRAAAPALPDAARAQLHPGHVTTFGNGQRWTLVNGAPQQVQ